METPEDVAAEEYFTPPEDEMLLTPEAIKGIILDTHFNSGDKPDTEAERTLFACQVIAKIQLAKVLKRRDRPVCKRCRGKKGWIATYHNRWVDCPVCKGAGRVDRPFDCAQDRPDREKIAELLYSFNTRASERRAWYLVGEAERKIYYNEADQILALFPDYTQGVKDERERIIEWGNEDCPHYASKLPNSTLVYKKVKRTCPTCWAELKKEGE